VQYEGMSKTPRNRSGVPSEANLPDLSNAELEREAARVSARLGTPLWSMVSKLLLKKRHAIESEQARRKT
jgi:hypothetical protein